MGGHIICGIVVLFYLDEYLDSDQRIQVLSVLMPITAAYIISIIKDFIANKTNFDGGVTINYNYAYLSILASVLIILFNFLLLLKYPSEMVPDVPTLQKWLSWSETGLGATFGLVLKDLFKAS